MNFSRGKLRTTIYKMAAQQDRHLRACQANRCSRCFLRYNLHVRGPVRQLLDSERIEQPDEAFHYDPNLAISGHCRSFGAKVGRRKNSKTPYFCYRSPPSTPTMSGPTVIAGSSTGPIARKHDVTRPAGRCGTPTTTTYIFSRRAV